MDLAAGTPTTNEQREAAFAFIRSRKWMDFYMEPIWHKQRCVLTEKGFTALEAM